MHDTLTYRQEIYRKFIHLSSSVMALALWYFGKETFLPWLIGVAIILPLLDYGRHHIDLLRRIYTYFFTVFTRPIEYRNLSGASWVVIGAALTTIIFNENTAIIGLLVLSLADSAAAIIGLKFGNTHLFNKSLEGSAAIFIVAFLIVFYLSPAFFLINLIAVSSATAVELFSTARMNDNLFIPLVTAFILTLGGVA